MKEKLIADLFVLQKKLKNIQSYTLDNSLALFKYSIVFELYLEMFLKINPAAFSDVYDAYCLETIINCRLCCELTDENNSNDAFIIGWGRINENLKECLIILTANHLDFLPPV